MTDCSSVNASNISGIGTAKAKWKAIRRSLKAMRHEGRITCLPGACSGVGEGCGFDPGTITIEVTHRWEDDGDKLVYEATATSSGGKCVCQ